MQRLILLLAIMNSSGSGRRSVGPERAQRVHAGGAMGRQERGQRRRRASNNGAAANVTGSSVPTWNTNRVNARLSTTAPPPIRMPRSANRHRTWGDDVLVGRLRSYCTVTTAFMPSARCGVQ